MIGYESLCFGFACWWVIPIVMIIMMALCFLMMRGRMGRMMCGPFSRTHTEFDLASPAESAKEILDKRYARGEIGKEEYEEKKKAINGADT